MYETSGKARSARDEWEHVMCLAEQDHLHQQERMTQQIKFARLELELSHARREEEEARICRIALECGLRNAYHVVLDLKCDYTQQTLQVWDMHFEFTELKCKFPSLGTKEEEELLLDKLKHKFPSFGTKEEEELLLDKLKRNFPRWVLKRTKSFYLTKQPRL
ncbi:hypothetical protein F4604DRAFT_1937013 [Suillus subluteus]|nr:hypothetical protein F4604DRAFT_1937013 [Suillus subluteus]